MKNKTYDEVLKDWGNSRTKTIRYKDEQLRMLVFQAFFDRIFYIGELEYYEKGKYNPTRTSFESIHYDKVVSRFQRFVDEYCTDWKEYKQIQHKTYYINIDKEKDKEFYVGFVQFHKNSTYKHIADTREEVERCCKNRIDRVIYEKEKIVEEKNKKTTTFYDEYRGYELVITYEPTTSYPYETEPYVGRIKELLLSWRGKTPEDVKKEFRNYFDKRGMGRTINMITPKNQKIQELEQLLARISSQLEELKKEKDILTYKGVVLEYEQSKSDTWVFVGKIRNAPENIDVRDVCGDTVEEIQRDFEEYIDWLEDKYNLYRKLMVKSLKRR